MTINMEKPYVVGMDIGGTNTVFGIVDSRGNVLVSDSVKTQQYDKINEYVDAVCKKLLPLLQQVGGRPMAAPTVLGAVYTTVTSVSQSPVTAYLPLPAGIK